MAKFRFIEAFYSLQGEGKYVGVPSVFLRMYGCNFTCQGFGMPKGEVSNAYKDIDVKKAETLKDLPLVHTGCDSYAAWDPRCKHLTTDMNEQELADELVSLLPNGTWNGVHLVITGGEPLLGWQKSYIELFKQPKMKDLEYVTFETNCTQPLRKEFVNYIRHSVGIKEILFSCSPKLSASGEKWDDAIKPEIAKEYEKLKDSSDMYFKFVVENEGHLKEVEEAVNQYKEAGVHIPVYIMPVGGCIEEYQQNQQHVADLAMKYKFKYSPRLHVDIWGNKWAT